MTDKLRKFRFDATDKLTKPATRQQAAEDRGDGEARSLDCGSEVAEGIKAEILGSLKEEISQIIRDELKRSLTEDFTALKAELQSVRAEIANNTSALGSRLATIENDVVDVQNGLSGWSDEVVALQSTVEEIKREMKSLKEKSEEMEGRMRRGNIRIEGIEEQPNSSNPTEVSKVLQQALKLDRDIKVDRSHRTRTLRKPGDSRPRVIIAKLHYEGDAIDILRRARETRPLYYNGKKISIFPDYTSSVAKARAAFTDVRKALNGRNDVRFGMFFPAKLRITYNSVSKDFQDPKEAMDYVQRDILPSSSGDLI